MKKFLIIMALCTLLISSFGCTNENEETIATIVPTSEVTATPEASILPERTFPPVSEATEFETKNEELAYRTSQLLTETPNFEYCPEYDPVGYPGIKAIWIFGENYGKKQTRIFAYIGIPETENNEKVPGVVLMHGGGGYAYPSWVKIWNDRGYAAIAVCNTGYYPKTTGITDFYSASSWTHSLTSELKSDGTTLPPDNDGLVTYKAALNKQWIYHAVTQSIIANSILRSLEIVDENKVGITGISWGGVITSTAIGYDDRFAFAIPVYGSAFLKDNKSSLGDNYKEEACIALWDPLNRIDYVDTPTLWVAWTNDVCFSLNSNSDSYLHTKDYSYLCSIMDLGHGHLEGWSRPEIYEFADFVTKGGSGLIKIIDEPTIVDNEITCTFKAPSNAKDISAKLYYITEKMTYSLNGAQTAQYANMRTIDQTWKEVDCNVKDGKVTVSLPSDLHSYYIEISFSDGENRLVTTSSFVEN